MSYRIAWSKTARTQLAEAWLQAPDRNVLSRNVHLLETALGMTPWAVGESRLGNRRVIIFDRMIVEYYVIEDDRRAKVTSLRMM